MRGKKALLLLDENYHKKALKIHVFFLSFSGDGSGGSVDKLNKVVFPASCVGSSQLSPL